MPLRAIGQDEIFNAFEYEEGAWREFKANYKNLDIKLPCCNADAIPKTSKLGSFFFAHKKQGECTSKPESAEHIHLKSLIAKAAMEAGWVVMTEFFGKSNIGEEWVADVYCTKGKYRVALEAQLSYITYDDLKARTKKYENSGVRVAWFLLNDKFRENYAEPSKAIPIFIVNSFAVGESPALFKFNTDISEFVFALLNKRVNWVEEEGFLEYHIEYIDDTCHACKNTVKQILGYSTGVFGVTAMSIPHLSAVLEEVSDIVNKDELYELGLNYIQYFNTLRGKPHPYPIYSNICARCNACQDNYFVMNHLSGNKLQSEKMIFKKKFTVGSWTLNKSQQV